MKRAFFIAIPAIGAAAALGFVDVPANAAATAPTSFAMCAACHSMTASGPKKMGPHLAGVYKRKAGAVAGFAYSPALKNSGIVWDTAKLDNWLQSPGKMVPGNKMAFGGISDAKKRAELIAYMKTL